MRQLQRGLLRYVLCAAVGSVFVSVALAAPPETYAGKPVRAEQWTISGGATETFYATEDGFIPMSTDRVKITSAGPDFQVPKDGGAPSFAWAVTLRFAEEAMPQRVKVENVTGPEAETLVDEDGVRPTIVMDVNADGVGSIRGKDWTARSPSSCKIARDNPCSAWIFHDAAYYLRLRFTIEYRDGSRETIYQGAKFDSPAIAAQLGLGE